MKKQMNAELTAGKKLRLNKKTISNLAAPINSHNYWDLGPSKNPLGCFTRKCNPSW